MSSTSTKPETPDEDFPELPTFTATSDTYAHELYRDVVDDSEIQDFLEETNTYNSSQKKWSTPEAPTKADGLIHSVYSILSSIVQCFVKITERGVERVLDNTYGIPECEAINEKGYRVCPLLVIQATGPSFQIPKASATNSAPSRWVEPSQMTTFISVKLESDAGSVEELVDEMTTYARYVVSYNSFVILLTDFASVVFYVVNRIVPTFAAWSLRRRTAALSISTAQGPKLPHPSAFTSIPRRSSDWSLDSPLRTNAS